MAIVAAAATFLCKSNLLSQVVRSYEHRQISPIWGAPLVLSAAVLVSYALQAVLVAALLVSYALQSEDGAPAYVYVQFDCFCLNSKWWYSNAVLNHSLIADTTVSHSSFSMWSSSTFLRTATDPPVSPCRHALNMNLMLFFILLLCF